MYGHHRNTPDFQSRPDHKNGGDLKKERVPPADSRADAAAVPLYESAEIRVQISGEVCSHIKKKPNGPFQSFATTVDPAESLLSPDPLDSLPQPSTLGYAIQINISWSIPSPPRCYGSTEFLNSHFLGLRECIFC